MGAPEAELFPPYEYNVSRPGAVYRCEPGYRNYAAEGNVRTLDRCSPMQFDKNPSKYCLTQVKPHGTFGRDDDIRIRALYIAGVST